MPPNPVPAPANDPFVDAVDGYAQRTVDRAAGNVATARQQNPDEVARNLTAADALNLPPSPDPGYNQVLQAVQQNAQTHQTLQTAPRTAAFYADMGHAVVAQDDVPNLAWWEHDFRTMAAGLGTRLLQEGMLALVPGAENQRIQRSFARGYTVGQGDISQTVLGSRILGIGDRRATEQDRQQFLANARVRSAAEQPPWYDVPGNIGRIVPQLLYGLPSVAQGATQGAAAGAMAGAALTPEALGAGAIPGFFAGLGIGATVGSFRPSLQTNAALAYEDLVQMRDETGQPIPDEVARTAALGIGYISAAIDMVGAEKLSEVAGLHGLQQTGVHALLQNPTARRALLNLAQRLAVAGGANAADEAAQQAAQIILENAAQAQAESQMPGDHHFQRTTLADALAQTAQAGFIGGVAGAHTAAVPVLARFHGEVRASDRASVRSAFFDAMAANAGESNLRRRMPQAYEDALGAITRDGPVDHVYVNAEAFQELFQSQNADPHAQMSQLGLDPAELDRAIAEGGDIAIPLRVWAARVAGTPADAALRDHVKLRPDDMTEAERRTFEANYPELHAQITAEHDRLSAMDPEEQTLRQTIHDRLAGAGFTEDQIATQTEPMVAAYRTAAQRTGLSIGQVHTAIPVPQVHVEGGRPAPARAAPADVAAAINAGASGAATPSYLTNLAHRESSFRPAATTGSSSAQGLYQFTEATWVGTVRRHGTPEEQAVARSIRMVGGHPVIETDAQRQLMAARNDMHTATRMAAGLTNDNARALQDGLGHVPSESELYIAHFLGVGGRTSAGALAFLRADGSAEAASIVPAAARSNPTIFYTGRGAARRPRTVAEVRAVLAQGFDGGEGAPLGAAAAPAAEGDQQIAMPPGPQPAQIADSHNTPNDLTDTERATREAWRQDVATLQNGERLTDPDTGAAYTVFREGEGQTLNIHLRDPEGNPIHDVVSKGGDGSALGFVGHSLETGSLQRQGGELFQSTPPNPVAQAALDITGRTRQASETGFILTDGTMLDMSGRHQVGRDYQRNARGENVSQRPGGGDDFAGQRYVDHRDVAAEVIASGAMEGGGDPAAQMTRFMTQGQAVRYSPGSGAEATTVPTEAQARAIIAAHRQTAPGEPLDLDASDPQTGRSIGIKTLVRPTVEAIQKFYRETLASNDPRILFQSSAADGAPIYRSALETAIAESKTTRASAEQWKATLSRAPGVKAEELEWTGILDWLDLQEGPVTRQQLADFMIQYGVAVEEVLLGDTPDPATVEARAEQLRDAAVDEAMEDVEVPAHWVDPGEDEDGNPVFHVMGDGGEPLDTYDTEEEAEAARERLDDQAMADARSEVENSYGGWNEFEFKAREELGGGAETMFEAWQIAGAEASYRELLLTIPKERNARLARSFTASHWEEPDVLAHTRFTIRHDTDGNEVLFIEEVQSDWHQKGRDQGYEGQVSIDPTARELAVAEARVAHDEAIRNWRAAGNVVANLAKESPRYEQNLKSALRRLSRPEDENLGTLPAPEFFRIMVVTLREYANDANGNMTVESLRAVPPEYDAAIRQYERMSLRMEETRSQLGAAHGEHGRGGIPNAPFKASWPALVMKRMIRYAVDHGFTRMALATGQQNVDRYELDQPTGQISVAPAPEQDGAPRVQVIVDNGHAKQVIAQLRGRDDTYYSEDEVKRIFGPVDGPAIWEQGQAAPETGATYESPSPIGPDSDGPTVGGHGMRQFYDRNLISITNQLIKKGGGRVETMPVIFSESDKSNHRYALGRVQALEEEVARARPQAVLEQERPAVEEAYRRWIDMRSQPSLPGEAGDRLRQQSEELRRTLAPQVAELSARENLRKAREELANYAPGEQPGFTITPALAEAARGGFTLFQDDQSAGEKRGSIVLPRGGLGQGREAVINLFKARDLSTFIHESGHFFLEMLHALASAPEAPASMKADLATVLNWMNVPDFDHIGVREHEKWAESVEQYFYEGKAPSLSLRGVFENFRSWLVFIYRRLKGVNLTLTDEVRGVMDRLLATDDEIATARAAADMDPLFTSADVFASLRDPKAQNLDPEAYQAYVDLHRQAIAAAHAEADARVLSVMRRQAQSWWREAQRQMRAEVEAEVVARPVYRAFEWLAHGRWLGEDPQPPDTDLPPMKLDAQALRDEYGAEAFRKLPRGFERIYTNDGGVDPDVAAQAFGYDSGGALIDDLLTMRRRADVVDEETAQRLQDQYGDPMNDGTLPAVALEAVHNPAQARVIETELRLLEGRRAGKGVAEGVRRAIAERKVSDLLNPERHLVAERRAARAAMKAFEAGDRTEAARQKFRQLVAYHSYVAVKAAADEINRDRNYVGKFDKPGTRKALAGDYIEQIDALLERFNFKPASRRQIERSQTLAEFAAKMDEQGMPTNIDQRLIDDARRRHYTDLTMEELRGLIATLKNLEALARLKNELLDNKTRRDFQEIIDEFLGQTFDLKAGPIDENLVREPSLLRQLDAGLWKVETLANWLDANARGGLINGVLHRILIRPAGEAANQEGILRETIGLALKQHFEAVPAALQKRWRLQRMTPAELINPQTGRPYALTRGNLIAIALNVGNQSNLDKLLGGYGWDEQAVMSLLDRTLEREEWEFVQGVWTTLNSMWPAITKVEKLLTGEAPEAIEPKPVVTRHGTFPGGYYPAVYDPDKSMQAGRNAAKEANDMFGGIFNTAKTPNGHTVERTAYVGPMLLSVERVLFGHINKVIKRVTYGEFVLSAKQFIEHPLVKQMIVNKVGTEYYDLLMPWLQRQVNDGLAPERVLAGWEKMLDTARINTQIVAMGFRASTGIAQTAGLTASAEVVGPKWLAAGTAEMARMGFNTQEFIWSRSEEMRQRANNLDRDMRDLQRSVAGKDDVIANVQRVSMLHIALVDQYLVSFPTWLGGYLRATSEGLGEDDAIASGDKAVRESQGVGRAYALSAVQDPQGKMASAIKLTTMFYSYFNVLYQRQRMAGRAAATGDFAKVARITFWWMIAAPIVGAMLSGDLPQDDEGWLEWVCRKLFFGLWQGIPWLRDAANTADRQVSHQFGSYSVSPLNRFGESVLQTAQDWRRTIAPGPNETAPQLDRLIKESIETPGYFVGLPTGQAANTLTYLWDIMDGEQRPEGVNDWYQGLIHGPRPDQRR